MHILAPIYFFVYESCLSRVEPFKSYSIKNEVKSHRELRPDPKPSPELGLQQQELTKLSVYLSTTETQPAELFSHGQDLQYRGIHFQTACLSTLSSPVSDALHTPQEPLRSVSPELYSPFPCINPLLEDSSLCIWTSS